MSQRCAPGDRIGSYVIEQELGASGAGVLFEVAHVVLPRRAVMKVMHAAVAGYPLFAVQMLREACLLEAMHHPGIPKVFESGRLGDGRPYFTVELVDGDSLAELLAKGPLPLADAIALIRDLAGILEHAHRRGIVHRSLRPERIRIAGGRACVTDWSEARTHDAASTLPHVPTPGSRTYVAPELARGDTVDDRADIYALGVIAHLALTGTLPNLGVSPEPLATLVAQMLADDRFDRPTSTEILAALPEHLPEAVVLVEIADDVELPRTRKLRWTPAYGMRAADVTDDDRDELTPS